MKAEVVLDDWKLPIFKKHLDKAGYTYEQFSGPTQGCITLSVETEFISTLQPVIEKCQTESAKRKKELKKKK